MAPFRRGGRGGRGGFSRGGRGGRGGFSRGGTRGGIAKGDRLARSGIKTKHGYRRFDSQREKDGRELGDGRVPLLSEQESESEGGDSDDGQDPREEPGEAKPYSALIEAFQRPEKSEERKQKRRKIEKVEASQSQDEVEEPGVDEVLGEEEDDAEDPLEAEEIISDDEGAILDPYQVHLAQPDDNDLTKRITDVKNGDWKLDRQPCGTSATSTTLTPACSTASVVRRLKSNDLKALHLKERLAKSVSLGDSLSTESARTVATYLFEYTDLLVCNRNTQNTSRLRNLATLHAVNHILKGRDRVLKHNEQLARADGTAEREYRDQGFVRPKVLILLETRQMAAKYADSIVKVFQPEQQENRKRFDDAFTAPLEEREDLPDDFRELFEGNNDNSFLTALKFTRKTLKYYSAFYSSDIIIASPLGLRRIIENEDAKKRDHDFLSSIELVIVDQADAMQMQSWENVDVVFKHLNLQPKEAHGCDFSRVRHWYLNGNARYLRQTVLFSAYMTPEMNRLFNLGMLNVAGKVKILPNYSGTITTTGGMGVKQTFSRFSSPTPSSDPDARFKYFTTAVIPGLLRLPKPADGAHGILVFIPSYYDFLRVRNHFASSTQTENISFGAIHDYNEISEQRRARSHFLSGRHSILLYTQRAHHFFRLKIRGVKRLVMYGLPDNPIFYEELVDGFLGTSLNEGRVDQSETGVRSIFSKWDGLRLERIVGGDRVKGMLGGAGDTFDFL